MTMNPRTNLDQASKGIPMLKDKVAIVTGSTSGIGLGIARELARLGANLVLNGFGDASEIEAIREGIERNHGVRAIYDSADMSKADAVRGLIAATVEKFGRLDILVNNAGIQFTAPVDEFPTAKWDAILGNQSIGGVPRHCDRGASDEKAALGTDRQHRLHPWPRRFNT
jgi:3-hydroxybutyrate dehydrogenase